MTKSFNWNGNLVFTCVRIRQRLLRARTHARTQIAVWLLRSANISANHFYFIIISFSVYSVAFFLFFIKIKWTNPLHAHFIMKSYAQSCAANAKPILVQNLIHRIKCVEAQGKSPDLFLFCGYAMQNNFFIHLHTSVLSKKHGDCHFRWMSIFIATLLLLLLLLSLPAATATRIQH